MQYKTILAAALTAVLAGCATSVPDAIKAPDNQVVTFESPATGVQIYVCSAAKDNPARYEWAFKGPEADLFDSSGKKIGKHYGGPTWEADDGSKVVAEVKARDNGPDANAIPWLLLNAKSVSVSRGVFSNVSSIQRVATVGGKAPADGCSQAQAGKEARVPYKATYYFLSAASKY